MRSWLSNLSKKKRTSISRLTIGYFLGWFLYFSWFWSHAFSTTPEGNILANHINIWGDWAAHFTMGSSMAYKHLFTTTSPFLLDAAFRYPFFVNFFSAMLIKLGVPFFGAFISMSFLTSMLCIFALWLWYRTWLKSAPLALLAACSFLLNGGIGGVLFLIDVTKSQAPLTTLLNPAHEYTRIDTLGIKWISIIDSMIIPQRAFALGFPVAVICLTVIYSKLVAPLFEKKSLVPQNFLPDRRQLTKKTILLWSSAGALALLPLMHTHSYLNIGFTLAVWTVVTLVGTKAKNRNLLLLRWLCIAIPAGIGGVLITQLLYKAGAGFTPQWYPGWYAREYHLPFLIFWWRNWGITPYLALLGTYFLVKTQKENQKKFLMLGVLAPFWLLFGIGNLWLFQPFIWDNTKFFVWSQLGFSGMAVFALAQLWKKSEAKPKLHQITSKVCLIFMYLFLISAGTVDAFRILRTHLHQYTMYSQEERMLAEIVKRNTAPTSIWLTSDRHNNWLFNLTGRQPLMAYRGWLWTHGYRYQSIEHDQIQMMQQPAKSESLFKKYEINYIVSGPSERVDWVLNEEWFETHCNLLLQTKNYSIFNNCRWTE